MNDTINNFKVTDRETFIKFLDISLIPKTKPEVNHDGLYCFANLCSAFVALMLL